MTITRLRRLAVIGGTALVLAACTDEKQDVFTPEGDRARDINELQIPVFAVAGIVGVLVAIAMVLAIVKGRRAFKNDTDDPVQLEGNFKLEIAWTIAPALLLGAIALFTVVTLLRLDDNDASASELDGLEITVYGQQWWWSYEYEVGDGDDDVDIITANDLVIPAGVPITLNIESRDVIHSFWVPSLNGTVDAAPGRSHSLVIEADEPGEFYGQCKEYCGLSHANMKLRVVALSEADFATWKDQQQQQQEMLAEGDFGFEGQAIFLSLCSQCHQINGLEDAEGQPLIVDATDNLVSGVAPNLTHLMSREVFAGAMF